MPDSYPKLFSNSNSNSRKYSNSKDVPWGLIPRGILKKIELGDSLSMDPFAIGRCNFYMKSFLKKYPFKGTGKPSKLFYLILRGHEQASGVSYPSKQISAGYQTLQNNFLRGIIPLGTNFCGVSDRSKQFFTGYHTPINKFLRGIIPLRTKFRGVSDPSE